MIKMDIVKQLSERMQIKERNALELVDIIIHSLRSTIYEHGRMELRNFGVFRVRQRKSRIGRNPRDRKEYMIQPHKVVTFRLGKNLRGAKEDAVDEFESTAG